MPDNKDQLDLDDECTFFLAPSVSCDPKTRPKMALSLWSDIASSLERGDKIHGACFQIILKRPCTPLATAWDLHVAVLFANAY